ncbi:MAG: class I tRNA ligase family protein, partial [Lachnospiraceae bacterium]|nr:class I tRNA ligase family protein [Lachnospiraceae bacterium]
SAPWLPNRFHDKAVQECQRKFMGTLWNTYAFFVLYANIDSFDASKYTLEPEKLPVMDKWILSKLNSCVKQTDACLDSYKITEAAKCLQEFVDDMSNWYVRRSRERFWAPGMEQDKINAYMTLYTCLLTICKAAAPMIPFMTEEIYQNLVLSVDPSQPESIHLLDYPVCDESLVDEQLEKDMEEVLDIVVLGRAARNAVNIKNRQPIARMYVKAEDKLSEFYTDIVADELNVKSVEFSDDVRGYTTYTMKPQLRTVGPRYGKQLQGIRDYLAKIDGNEAMDRLNAGEDIRFDVDGSEVVLGKDDLLIEMTSREGFVEQADGGITVVLDTNLTPELIGEGFVRELISKIQTMRKEAGFEVMDRITVYSEGNDRLADYLSANRDFVLKEVMASDIVAGSTDGYTKEWDINGEHVTLGVKVN